MAGVNLWLFRKPLKDTEDRIKAHHDAARAEKYSTKIRAVRTRMKVLVFTACISSISYIVIGGGVGLWFLFGLDNVINCLSLAFMGPYYDDHTNDYLSYRKLCHVCAKCCDRKGYSMQYDSTRKRGASTGESHRVSGVSGAALSGDTLSAHAHIAEKLGGQPTTSTELRTIPSPTQESNEAAPDVVIGTAADYKEDDGISPMAVE